MAFRFAFDMRPRCSMIDSATPVADLNFKPSNMTPPKNDAVMLLHVGRFAKTARSTSLLHPQ
jgi:hypothetical protein